MEEVLKRLDEANVNLNRNKCNFAATEIEWVGYKLVGQKGNKTYFSRLTRWVDRLLLFEYEVLHGSDRTLGITDYLSRNPSFHNESSIKAKTLWDEWFIVNIVSEKKTNLLANRNAIRGEWQPIRNENFAAEQTCEHTSSDAANGLKQTIKDALN